MVDEAHITTFAVHPDWRRQRHRRAAAARVPRPCAVDRGAREATLEVRLSNLPARRLYEKYGFRPVGLRPRYYSDDNEDALIMTTEALRTPAMRDRIDRGCAPSSTPRRRPERPTGGTDGSGAMSGPLVLAIESSCDETGIALDRGRPDDPRNVVASPGRAPRGVRRDRARGRRAGPPALDRAGPRRGLGGRRVSLDRHRRRGRHLRARVSRARCSSASTSRRRWRGSTTGRWSGSTTSRATSTRPGWPIPTRRTRPSRSSRSSPWWSRAGTRSSSR